RESTAAADLPTTDLSGIDVSGITGPPEAGDDAVDVAAQRKPKPRKARPTAGEDAGKLEPITRPVQLELSNGAGMYTLPSLGVLGPGTPHMEHTKANDEVIAALQQVFAEFEVDCAVTGFNRGPTVTR